MTDFTIPRQQSAENTDKPEVDLSAEPARAQDAFCTGLHKTLELEVGKETGAGRQLDVTHAAMLIGGAASVWTHHDGEPASWRSS